MGLKGDERASLVAQRLKGLPAMQETWVGKIPWRRKWQPTPVFLPGESHGLRSLVRYSPQGCKELDTTERLHFTYHHLTLLTISTMVEVMKIMVTSFKRSHACTATLLHPQPCSRPPLTHPYPGDSWTLTGAAERSYPTSEVRGGGQEELRHIQGQEG